MVIGAIPRNQFSPTFRTNQRIKPFKFCCKWFCARGLVYATRCVHSSFFCSFICLFGRSVGRSFVWIYFRWPCAHFWLLIFARITAACVITMNCQNVSQAINLLAQVCFTKFFNFFFLAVRCEWVPCEDERESVDDDFLFPLDFSFSFFIIVSCSFGDLIHFHWCFSLISFDSICCFLLFVFSFLIAFSISSSPTAYHISNFNMRLVFFGYDFSICQSLFPLFMALCFFLFFPFCFFSLSFSSFYSGVVFSPVACHLWFSLSSLYD